MRGPPPPQEAHFGAIVVLQNKARKRQVEQNHNVLKGWDIIA